MSLGQAPAEPQGNGKLGSMIRTSVQEEELPTTSSIAGAQHSRQDHASDEVPFDDSSDEESRSWRSQLALRRTYSMAQQKRRPPVMNQERITNVRRMSHDAKSMERPERRFIVDVDETMKQILEQEDTDRDNLISITDCGPKSISLGTVESNGYRSAEVRGTYQLSNLLQELALMRGRGEKRAIVSESALAENPVDRLSRMIRHTFWNNLTRHIDADGLEAILLDPKNRSKHVDPIIYVPHGETNMIEYYNRVAVERPALRLQVEVLPEKLTAELTRDLNERPGLLAIAMQERLDPEHGLIDMQGVPFVVPGSRFNEFYNWDSYFIGLGLLADHRIDLAKGVVEHYIFEIKHYHKILNGNRTYYLMRSQPPFLTDIALQVYTHLLPSAEKGGTDAAAQERIETSRQQSKEWLRRAIRAAIKEYHTVWMSEPRLDKTTGLSRYRPEGLGVPPETEASHFTSVLRPYAEKYGCSINEFTSMYNQRLVDEPELDEYFMHDRAVRESGHDTSYRLERRCANMATVDLNSLLYKYETDIAYAIREVFDDALQLEEEFTLVAPLPPSMQENGSVPRSSREQPQTSAEWLARAEYRKEQMNRYCWNEGKSLFYDYDTVLHEQSLYESVTAYWTLWAGLASPHQVERMVRNSLHKFEETGGLVPGTEESRGPITLARPNRQWDYPFAWPPHQILAWIGLERYGYLDDARRIAYRWLYMMTKAFVDYNGVVPEKFDAVKLSHKVTAEYGNQGLDFAFVPTEGFGWMNASYQVGLRFLTDHMRKAVAALQHPNDFFRRQVRRR